MLWCWEHWRGFHFIARSVILNLFLLPLSDSAVGRTILVSKVFSELADPQQDAWRGEMSLNGPSRGDRHLLLGLVRAWRLECTVPPPPAPEPWAAGHMRSRGCPIWLYLQTLADTQLAAAGAWASSQPYASPCSSSVFLYSALGVSPNFWGSEVGVAGLDDNPLLTSSYFQGYCTTVLVDVQGEAAYRGQERSLVTDSGEIVVALCNFLGSLSLFPYL